MSEGTGDGALGKELGAEPAPADRPAQKDLTSGGKREAKFSGIGCDGRNRVSAGSVSGFGNVAAGGRGLPEGRPLGSETSVSWGAEPDVVGAEAG